VAGARRHLVQVPAGDAVDSWSRSATNTRSRLLDVVDDILVQPVLVVKVKQRPFTSFLSPSVGERVAGRPGEGRLAARSDSSRFASRPKRRRRRLRESTRPVVVLAQCRGVGGDLAVVEAIQSAAVGAEPEIATAILVNHPHIRMRQGVREYLNRPAVLRQATPRSNPAKSGRVDPRRACAPSLVPGSAERARPGALIESHDGVCLNSVPHPAAAIRQQAFCPSQFAGGSTGGRFVTWPSLIPLRPSAVPSQIVPSGLR